MYGNSPKEYTIPGRTLSVFRCCPAAESGKVLNVEDFNIYDALPTAASSDPEVTVSTDEITGFSYGLGQGPSAAQTFTVSGANLENEIDISIVDDKFELSLTENGIYSGSLSLTPTDGTVAETTVYVRMVAGLDAGDVLDYVLIESDAADEEIELSGEVVPTHTLTYSATHGSISGVLSGTSTVVASGASVAEGGEVDITADPDDNYRFASWEVSGIGSSLLSTTNNPTTFTMGTANATVTANFERVYTVTCATGLTNGSVESDVDVAAEDDIVTITATPANGYMLNTITVAKEGGGNIDEGDIDIEGNTAMFAMPADNVTVSATFTEKTATFTNGIYSEPLGTQVSFDNMRVVNVEGEDTWFLESNYSCTTIDGASTGDVDWLITPKMQVDNGKLAIAFKIWHDQSGKMSLKWSSSNDVNGEWSSIEFDEGDESEWVDVNKDIITSESDVFVAFVYDNTSTGDEGEYSIKNFTAKQYYNVTFDKNNNAATGEMSALSCLTNTATALPANEFELEDYVFEGWAETADGAVVYEDEDDITITSNTTLYAKWLPSYSVTYHANGGTGSDIVEKYADGETVTVNDNTFTYAGHLFKEWRTNSDGSGTKYEPGDEFNIEDDVDLYAIWDEACTITFNSNGLQHDEVKVKNSAFSLSAPNNIPEGYAYRGWTLDTENPSTLVGASYTPTEDVTLYAVFGEVVYGNFVKVESAPANWSGRYLIVNDYYGVAFNGTVESDWGRCTSVTISSETINKTGSGGAPANGLVIISEGSTTGTYSFLFSSGDYMNWTAKKSFTEGETASDYTLAYATDHVSIKSSNNNYLRYNYNNGSGGLRSYDSDSSSDAIQLYKQSETPNPSSYETNVSAPVANNITITTPTIITNGTALNMGTHTLVNATAANLVIEDGGQLITTSANVKATVKKTTSASTAKTTNNWYGIASPINSGVIADFVQGTHNVYRYDEENIEWEEYRNTSNTFTTFENGRGYLYRSTVANVEYAGTVNTANVNYTLSYACSNDAFKGFNLIGNPFTHDIYKGAAGTAIPNGELLEAKYCVLNTDGTWVMTNDGTAIHAGTAILVQAKKAGTLTMYNSTTGYLAPDPGKAGNDNIWFTVKNSNFTDVACVEFKEGRGFNKPAHYNENAPMLYIRNNGENFASVDMPDDTKTVNLCFKATEFGYNTLSLKANGNFSYLHLIDKLTGEDVDMLLEGEYSFMASPTDNAERFIVRLEYSEGSETTESSFAYQNGSDIIVSGEGELQVFDVMGRLVMQKHVNGVERIHAEAQGVYIFKLNDKVQKIVIR